MGKLHEILAVEKLKNAGVAKLMQETLHKFGKIEFFSGHIKTLKMLEDKPENAAIEAQGSSIQNLPTTVQATLEYLFGFWAQAEDVTFQKNVTNQRAVADLMFRGTLVAKDVPVDELMGLEKRLEQVRNLFNQMPTLPAAARVSPLANGQKGAWIGEIETTTKTDKTTTAVTLYEATDKHPAQVKEVSKDVVVGKFELTKMYGSATSQQKADCISVIDDLISEAKQARMRANSVEAATDRIGAKLVEIFMSPFKQ